MIEKTKVEMYKAWRAGHISEREVRKFFGSEWNDVQEMADVQDILAGQPEPDLDRDDLLL